MHPSSTVTRDVAADRATPSLSAAHRWQLLDGSGWQFVLPPAPFGRLLCYDNLDGATLLLAARMAEEVLVVHHSAHELARLEAVAADAGLERVRFATLADAAASERRGPFDGALVHDPTGRVLRRRPEPGITTEELCARLASTLRPRGFLYLGFRNRFAYTRLRGPGGKGRRLLSPGVVNRAVQRAGLMPQPPHPFLMEEAQVAELVPPAGYRSAKNRFLPAERLREALLRGWGRRHLAPAYGLLGFRGAAEPSWLDRLVADPWVQALAPGSALRRCVVLNEGKLVVSLGTAEASHGTVVLVVTPDPVASERRRIESDWLRRLARLPPETSGMVPVSHGEREVHGVRVFALSERPGVTVDHDVPYMDELTAEAARWLRGFHRATAGTVELDARAFDRALVPVFGRARERNRPLSTEIDGVEAEVRRHLEGRALALAWLHGDYKLENVVFDERSRALEGIIDWELAWEPGPPLLDLLYLLLYNRVVRAGTGVMGLVAASEGALVRQQWTPDERAHLDAHHDALGTARELEPALGALFFVHHLGFRVTHDLGHTETAAQLRGLLSALRQRLATLGGS